MRQNIKFDFWNSNQVKYESIQQKKINTIYENLGYVVDRSKNCKDFDLTLDNGFMVETYEEKFRAENTERYKDFGVEILQDILTKNLGWFYTTKADYIIQVHQDEQKNNCVYFVKWSMFKTWFQHNYKSVNTDLKQCKTGFGFTLNIYIKWEQLPKHIYERIEI